MRDKLEFREHLFEEPEEGLVCLDNLTARRVPDDGYRLIHVNTVIATHDAVITYDGGVVLMERTGAPLKGFLWLPGGRMQRGVQTEDSLVTAVERECGLDISKLEFAGVDRAFMPSDPLGHRRGTDTITTIFYCNGQGELLRDVDERHNHPILVRPREYAGIRDKLHPFVQKYTDVAIGRISSGK
ncbi:MAG: NUDIX domain-containing protein [Nanoarchaeota archaeon]